MPTVLDQLRKMTVVVADTGEIDAVKRLRPVVCGCSRFRKVIFGRFWSQLSVSFVCQAS